MKDLVLSIASLCLMPFTLALMFLGMIVSLTVMMALMLYGAYFSTAVWLETKLYGRSVKERKDPVLYSKLEASKGARRGKSALME